MQGPKRSETRHHVRAVLACGNQWGTVTAWCWLVGHLVTELCIIHLQSLSKPVVGGEANFLFKYFWLVYDEANFWFKFFWVMCVCVSEYRLENILWELVLSFHPCGAQGWNSFVILYGKNLTCCAFSGAPQSSFHVALFHLTALRNWGCPNRSVSVLSEAAEFQSVEIILCYLLV